ncbi:MAG: histidine triad nucleotide-binding protein [Candidatus Omnitrophota bacterium]
MTDCIFCKILEGKIPSKIVYEDQKFLAFEDIKPKAPVHILLIPKKHIARVRDVKEENKELLGDLLLTADAIAKKNNIAESGYRTVINCNKDAGQEVPHLHLHILGGKKLSWIPG